MEWVPEADLHWGTDRKNLSEEDLLNSRLEGPFDDRTRRNKREELDVFKELD